MTVSLNRAYSGYLAGTIVTLDQPTELALIAQGLAVASTAVNTTVGNVTNAGLTGQAAFAIGASSVVVTNGLVNASSCVMAVVSQAAADATLLRVERVVPAAGSFTIFGTANATAATLVRWVVVLPGTVSAVN